MKRVLIILVVVLSTTKAYSQLTEHLPQSCNTIIQIFKLNYTRHSTINIICPIHVNSPGNLATNIPKFQTLSSNSVNIFAPNISAISQYHNKPILIKDILTKKISLFEVTKTINCWGGMKSFIVPIQFDLLKL